MSKWSPGTVPFGADLLFCPAVAVTLGAVMLVVSTVFAVTPTDEAPVMVALEIVSASRLTLLPLISPETLPPVDL